MNAAPGHEAWVLRAQPPAPAALTARVVDVLRANAAWDALPLAEALTLAGERLLAGVVAKGEGTARDRAAALDLLAADACVTWAFEVAAEQPDALPARAREVTARILSMRAT